MEKVAIIGASGFIGSHAMNAFKNSGKEVVGLTRHADAPGYHAVNYADVPALTAELKGVSSIVHIAGLAHLSSRSLRSAKDDYFSANVRVAVTVAKAAIAAGARRFILLSSAGVFGAKSPPAGFNDNVEPRPYNLYTESKLEAERCVFEIAMNHMELVILRPPMVYGPNAPGSFERLCSWIERGLPLPVGRIVARRSFVGIRNLCSAFVAAEAAPIAESLPMIVADRERVSIAEFAREIASASGRRSLILPVPKLILEHGLRACGLSEEYSRIALPFELWPSRIHSALNWYPPHSQAEELRWAKQARLRATQQT